VTSSFRQKNLCGNDFLAITRWQLSFLGSIGIHLLGWALHFAWLAAAFVCGGYLIHLLLDELYSVNFMGSTLKKSFGSALTLFNRSSWLSYLLLYAIVGAGFYLLPMPNHLI